MDEKQSPLLSRVRFPSARAAEYSGEWMSILIKIFAVALALEALLDGFDPFAGNQDAPDARLQPFDLYLARQRLAYPVLLVAGDPQYEKLHRRNLALANAFSIRGIN